MPGLVAMGHSNCTFVVGILVALLTFFLTKRQISRIWGTVRNLNVLNPHRALLVGLVGYRGEMGYDFVTVVHA